MESRIEPIRQVSNESVVGTAMSGVNSPTADNTVVGTVAGTVAESLNAMSRVGDVAGHVSGHVTVNERIPSQRFSRYVEEKIKDWIQCHDLDTTTEYEVAFFDEEALGEVSCLVVIQCGAQLWRAWESSDNSRLALIQTIERLKLEDHGADPSTGLPFSSTH